MSDGAIEFEGFQGQWECSVNDCDPPLGFPVNTMVSITDIEDALTTPQTIVTVDTLICAPGAYGLFQDATASGLGIDKGFVLTSGVAGNVGSPATIFNSLGNGFPGDEELDTLSVLTGNGTPSNDACVLELDLFRRN